MSVEPSELMSDVWTSWQGHVIDGVFPLGRYLGSSDHSGVFLTELRAREPSEVAIKLVPGDPELAESQLAEWNTAAGLAHPHLLRLLQTGRCQLDGQLYLYAVMEYADQTLAQLLRHRALTEEEVRELLLPTLSALAFLHNRHLVQGQLKPANILVVGDQLKLASDTIRRVTEAGARSNMTSVYDPPEARDGAYSAAGDIWGLGVSLFEALTRSPPSGLDERRGVVALPRDFSPTFHEIVARCLSRRPYDRPKVTELEAWVHGQSAGPAPVGVSQPAPAAESITSDKAPTSGREPTSDKAPASNRAPTSDSAPSGATVSESATESAQRPVVSAAVSEGAAQQSWRWRSILRVILEAAAQQSWRWRSLAPVILGAVVLLVLGWAGVRVFGTHRTHTPPAPQAPRDTLSQTPGAPAPVAPEGRSPVPAFSPSSTKPNQVEAAASPAVIHEEIPNIPKGARRTIHGHIRVSVRLIIDKDGSVFAALVDDPGPSRYFRRLAIEAAKKWTFTPADTEAQRLALVRFTFSREGATGHAVALR